MGTKALPDMSEMTVASRTIYDRELDDSKPKKSLTIRKSLAGTVKTIDTALGEEVKPPVSRIDCKPIPATAWFWKITDVASKEVTLTVSENERVMVSGGPVGLKYRFQETKAGLTESRVNTLTGKP